MTATLQKMLDRADRIAQRRAELTTRRDEIRVAKEKVFQAASENDGAEFSSKAFVKVGEQGAQESLLSVQLESLDREETGLRTTILAEADHVRRTLASKGRVKREALLDRIRKSVAAFVPEGRNQEYIVKEIAKIAPAVRELEQRTTSAAAFYFDPRTGKEIDFARQVFRKATDGLELIGNA